MRTVRLAASVALLGFAALHPAFAQSAEEKAKVEALLWEKEQNIYLGRAAGGLDYYLSQISENYVGWPPGQAVPADASRLRENAKRMTGNNQEKLTMEKTGFTMEGDTAVIYYRTHRTMRPDGKAVNEQFENIHVYTRRDEDWKLIGALARPMPGK
jgi:ketosteroid isomerase-like protein